MLMALNETNELIIANEKLCRENIYYCPACQQPVHLKIGVVMCTHFAHFKNEACDTFSEGETEEHIRGKIQIKEWLDRLAADSKETLKIEMEAYLPKLKQRPDLLAKNNKDKYAIEFQCSPISIEQLVKRTKGYLKHNYQVIWILGENFKFNNKLTSFQKACLFAEKNSQNLKLLQYNTQANELIVYSHFSTNKNKKLTYQTNIINLKQELPIKRQTKYKNKVTKNKINLKEEHLKLRKELQYPTSKSRDFFQLLYQNRENIITLPKELYYTISQEWLIQTYSFEWKYCFILWLESLPNRRIITKNSLNRWLEKQEKNRKIIYYEIPQLTKNQKLSPFYEMLNKLEKVGILKIVGDQQWRVLKPLKRYESLESKYNSFNSK